MIINAHIETRTEFFVWIQESFLLLGHLANDLKDNSDFGEYVIEKVEFFLAVMICVEDMLDDCKYGDGEAFIRFLIKLATSDLNELEVY